MLGSFFKPKWKHNNARIRMQALPSLEPDSPELIQLAQNDPNTGVRLEAIGLLTDFPTLIQLGKRTDPLGERARLRLEELSATANDHDADLAEVFDWFLHNPSLLESIARDDQRAPALRKLALAELTDEHLLFRIASEDGSKALQYLAASRLYDPEKLKQLEKTQGRNNKRLRQLVKERLAQQQEQELLREQLETLVSDMEKLGISERWAQEKTQHKVLQQRWTTLADTVEIPPDLEKRFRDAETVFLARLEKYEAHQAELEPLRAVFIQYLQEADDLMLQLEQTPGQLTLQTIDQQLELWQERWVTTTPLSDEEEQDALNQQWMDTYVTLTDKRDDVSGDLEALENLRACCQRAERMRDGKRFLQASQLTGLQSEWVKIKRPRQMSEPVSELEGRFHQLMDSLNARLLRETAERDEKIQHILTLLNQMEADLDQEKYGEAVDIHRDITTQLKQLSSDLPAKDKAQIERRLRAAAPMVMEFKDWRRWGTDQAREHLIETAQRLENDDSMDPEQRAREIKALREEWRRLAQMEPGKQRKQWKDFDRKVSAAYEPSKQHFAEQARQRAEHLQQREAVCAQLETLNTETDWSAETLDWKAEYAKINELRKAWKKCGTVSHKDWKAINKRFNAAIDALDEHLKTERERNFRERHQLMEQSAALAEIEDIQQAVSEAKQLQADWEITIPSRPGEEQKLWRQFRSPIDAVFKRLKTERQSQRSETDELIRQKDDLCIQLETMLRLDDNEFASATHDLAKLRNAFDTIQVPRSVQRKLEDRFAAAEQATLQRLEQLKWAQRLAKLDELAEQSAKTKSGDGNHPEAEALTQTEGEILCLQMEILLNLPTPAEFQQARMEYQVAQMRDAMQSRNDNQDIRGQGLTLLAEWYRLGAMPADALEQQQARIAAVRQAIAK